MNSEMEIHTANTVSVLIGGDLCPTEQNERLFMEGEAEAVFGDALSWFQSSDLSIVNLECPLVAEPSPISKTGPTLGAPVTCINAIGNAGIDVVTLANNHIMDHGSKGLASTLDVCQTVGIETVGAGEDMAAANKVLIGTKGGLRIGVIAMAEHEFSIAGDSRPGANPLDVISFVRSVREYRASLDYLVVLLHTGNEHYPYPRPSLMDMCRFMVEEGANAVVCQHSHCPGCIENYRGGHIVYGQGNLVFHPVTRCPESWYRGFLVLLRIRNNGESDLEVMPYEQSIYSPGVRLLRGRQQEGFLAELAKRSDSILDAAFLNNQWVHFCKENRNQYLAQLCTNTALTRKLMGRFRFFPRFWSKKSLLLRLNLIRCESHRDMLTQVLSTTMEEMEN